MANPFSAVPSRHRKHADGRIESSWPDCGEPLDLEVLRHGLPAGLTGPFYRHA
jgi:hypothetical protein